MSRIRIASLCAVLSLGISIAPPTSAEPGKSRQLVIVSFDGAHDNKLWARSRAIAEKTGARFTYFLSCTFLVTRDQNRTYRAPDQKAGRSNVGFAATTDDVRERLAHIWGARNEGHEIASHGCGHFDGKAWTRQQWKHELTSFSRFLSRAWRNADGEELEPEGWKEFAKREIEGFRAPYLSTNDSMISALKEAGYRYDASGVSRGPALPGGREGLRTFELPLIAEGPRRRRVIAMDYNLFVRHSGGLENPSQSREYEDRTYRAFRQAFDSEHEGSRRPLQIGMHFVEMNGGAYWRAMERLLSDVCHMEDVDCVSYREAMDRLELRGTDGGA